LKFGSGLKEMPPALKDRVCQAFILIHLKSEIKNHSKKLKIIIILAFVFKKDEI